MTILFDAWSEEEMVQLSKQVEHMLYIPDVLCDPSGHPQERAAAITGAQRT